MARARYVAGAGRDFGRLLNDAFRLDEVTVPPKCP